MRYINKQYANYVHTVRLQSDDFLPHGFGAFGKLHFDLRRFNAYNLAGYGIHRGFRNKTAK